jgi:glycosyltransferase involved in cell wall biosynthesis
LDPWQGLDKVVQAVRAAADRGLPVRLSIVGDGPEASKIRGRVEELGLRERVTTTGRVGPEEMAGYLARSDIGVSAYCGREEFSGLKLLDYKAAGLATIASGRNGKPEVLRDGLTGRIVEPCSQPALDAALVELAGDAALRREMGRRARLEAEEQHSWSATAAKLSSLMEGLV